MQETINSLEDSKVFIDYAHTPDALKNSLISKSNLFVMPSVIHKKSVEGFGIAYVEAAQFGIPSIGGKDGGAADAIKHNETGLICDGNNLDEVRKAIQTAKENCFNGKPVVIIMKTIMGNGVNYMMGTHKWHGVAPNAEELEIALNQNPETLNDY